MEDEPVVASSAGTRLLSSTPHAVTPTTTNNHLINLPPPPGHPLATYVVQVPKDQIYRVPPPENAAFVERHRKAAKAGGKKSKWNCSIFMIWFLIVFLLLCVIVGGTLTAIHFTFTPLAPRFSVTKLLVKQTKQGIPPTYDITLKAKNLNEKMGIEYKSDEDGASLIFWTKNLGFGNFPDLKQNVGDSNNVNIKIRGLKGKQVPTIIQKSISDKKTKRQISLKLKLESPLLFNVWILKLWKKDLDVNCDFRVSTMGQGTKILSQKCKTKLS
ncbi:Haloacid dehalogenase-like hydrolase (HAD) superfamily protein [Hibiscus syriacus]|uniref:Haloacid dehalogenase-like hydrolase (HAD) superfamily protein n=1 Tax=Hibiscus syriacus TaxID=106335 RepID=A0A6A2WCG7_HIBSY|nr:NDR1/HIN1-like protein 13 [Hibiscus syriacus]KAE8655862.1 Haloacid dehalogenase-like hydrolase (HAD) superfamily protein [Hibiscus syriacus]